MNKFWKTLATPLIVAILIFVAVAMPVGHVFAQGAGQGLEISPPLLDLKTDPGQTISRSIRLRNVTTQTLVARAQYNDFVASGEDGQPKLLLNSTESSPFSIKAWLSSIETITLAPQEQKTITLTINVPGDASPGGHYGVIRFTGTPPEVEESAVSLSASIGTLVLVNVSGAVKEEAKVAELFTADKNGKKRTLFEYGPIVITARIENVGNIHIQPSGVIRVSNMFGKEVASYQVNKNKGSVLPASIRKFEQTLDKKLLFGRYQIQADLVYGADNKIISSYQTFWAIPYKLIAIGIATIVALIFFIRGYNRLILKRARRKTTDAGKNKTK